MLKFTKREDHTLAPGVLQILALRLLKALHKALLVIYAHNDSKVKTDRGRGPRDHPK